MNCNHFHEQIELLFDTATPHAKRQELIDHMTQCQACTAYYCQCSEALDAVTPHTETRPSPQLKERILAAAADATPSHHPKGRLRSLLRPALASAAAIALLVVLFNPTHSYRAYAAGKLLQNAAAVLDASQGIYMEFDVRTLPTENFSYIDASQPVVTHRLWVAGSRWRVEKSGRMAICDGTQSRTWMPADATGTINAPGVNILEEFRLLLNPSALMHWEEAQLGARRKNNLHKEDNGTTIRLVVDAPAPADFTHDPMKNTSLGSGYSIREYAFDRQTGRLMALKISMRIKGKTIPVVELKRIEYDAQTPEMLFTAPDDIQWLDLRKPIGGKHLTGISAQQAVEQIVNAMQCWDTTLLAEGLPFSHLDRLRPIYEGARLIKCGKTIASNDYAGVFVECLVALPNGKQKKMRLAVRNDNEAGSWVIDGGI